MASKKQPKTRTDAVRAAVDQAFQATAGRAEQTQREVSTRVQDVTDELAGVVGRLRDALEDQRPVQNAELEELRGELAALRKRVTALEKSAKPAPRKAATRKPAASARGSAASKVPAARAAAKRAKKP